MVHNLSPHSFVIRKSCLFSRRFKRIWKHIVVQSEKVHAVIPKIHDLLSPLVPQNKKRNAYDKIKDKVQRMYTKKEKDERE